MFKTYLQKAKRLEEDVLQTRLEDVLKIRLKDVVKTSGKTENRYTEYVLENNKRLLRIKCLDLFKKVIVVAITFFSCNALECPAITNQECKIKLQIINSNSDFILTVLK